MLNKKNVFLIVNLLLVTALFYGCNARLSKMAEEQGSSDTALLFGYIDMHDAPSNLESVNLRQTQPGSSDPDIPMRADGEGLFYRENIPKGSYELTTFGGRGWTLGCLSFNKERYYYTFPEEGFKYNKFHLTKTGLVFLGSYKMNKVKRKYQFVNADSPGEKELLTKLLVYTQGTKWENVIRNRLKQL